MRRILELRDEGRTMVFVSHNPKQVVRLCQRGIVLKAGEMAYEGTAEGAVDALGYDLSDDDDDNAT
jgi:ABC-2 type transport system ATP-binding protein